MANRKTVVIGLLGPVLDSGRHLDRWEKWRPTVSLCQHDDLLVDRLELLHEKKFISLSKTVAADIASVSPETKVQIHEVQFDDAWDFESVYGALHDFARVYPFSPETEDYLVHITTGSHVAQICLFLLTESHYFPAKLIQTAPPSKQRGEPGAFAIIDLDLSRYDRLASRFNLEIRESTSFLKSGIATRNEPFNRLIERIEKVAIGSKAPLLLEGPTGAGKSQLARRIYELKKHRRQVEGAFVEINCATLRGDGAMSALFGHVKGSFTGAVQDRPGLLRVADGGVLFLDEVGELGADEQAMLLRAIEAKKFLPVGTDRESQSDFQLITGTNRELATAVREGRFREDLLARINLWTFQLPALRERPEDIEPNLEYELEQFARVHGTKVAFNKEARAQFLKFAISREATWSGNFRDLNAAVTRLATFAAGGRITADLVQDEIDRLRQCWGGRSREISSGGVKGLLKPSMWNELDLFDQLQLAAVVKVCRSNRSLSKAGRVLFAASRAKKGSTNDADRLRKYLARFGLDWAVIQEDIPGESDET